jgi:adenylate kinase family enzyme
MYNAILLLGPTGSGKTPLGACLAQKGIRGTRCFHFDFGNELRDSQKTEVSSSHLTENDRVYIEKALKRGALLENDTFYIAEKILNSFIARNSVTTNDFIILNGLPRHRGQAEDVEAIVDIKMVIYLECSPEVVTERIRLDTGSDRSGRIDDSAEEIEKKLALFQKRTASLLQHYRNKKIPVEMVKTDVNTRPEEIVRLLAQKNFFHL